MILKKSHCLFLLLSAYWPNCGNAESLLSFEQPLICNYRYNQWMSENNSGGDDQNGTLEWNFLELTGDAPKFFSAGDFGSVVVWKQTSSNGISIFLTQASGAHLFSIWPDGTSFWSKQNEISGKSMSQQFRGNCINGRNLNEK